MRPHLSRLGGGVSKSLSRKRQRDHCQENGREITTQLGWLLVGLLLIGVLLGGVLLGGLLLVPIPSSRVPSRRSSWLVF
jgi:hypothetical protein